jgi:hypothetical protein
MVGDVRVHGRNCEVGEVWMMLRSGGMMMRLGRCI